MNKTAIKNFAVGARVSLISAVTQRAYEYEITKDGENTAALDQVSGRPLTPTEKSQRSQLIARINEKGFDNVMEEAAYTWFNRFTALRYMEVNGYLPTRIKVFSNENDEFKPEILSQALDVEIEGLDKSYIVDLIDAQDNETLYKYLLIAQCNALNKGLPELFEQIGGWTELLFPRNLLREDSVIARMVKDIPQQDWQDQVQIIGWLYQYYNSEPKDKVFANLKKNIKISKDDIPAATQLFTPDWIVRYMVENSLGRLWAEGHEKPANADWKYYLEEAQQEESVKAELEKLRAEYAQIKPEQIKFLDPCMGSGHILVYAFDVFMDIYTQQGWSERDAAVSIITKNLYGLDIDKRAYQLAYFSLMMKARQYCRRLFEHSAKGECSPNLANFQDIGRFSTDMLTGEIAQLAGQFENCDTYGSLIDVQEIQGLDEAIDEFHGVIGFNAQQLERMMQLYKILSQQYDVVCTNPPYMGNGPALLAEFLFNKYTEEKYDLYAAFVVKCLEIVKKHGYSGMITGDSWMFLPSFDKMRNNLIINKTLINMAHMGFGAFEAGFGTTAFIILNNNIEKYKSCYERLAEVKDSSSKNELLLSFATNRRNPIVIDNDSLKIIEGTPWAYWIKESVLQSFGNSSLSKYAITKAGIVTGNNDFFIHYWYEVSFSDINFQSVKEREKFSKWVPAHKGGGSNKYYGNQDYIMRLKDLWSDRYYANNMRRGDIDYYFSEGITWSTLSNKLAFRYSPYGFVYETKGSMCFVHDDKQRLYCLGLLNSSLCNYILNILCPTLDYNRSSLLKIPCIISQEKKPQVNVLVSLCIEIAKTDWDSFETSWDFERHPLI